MFEKYIDYWISVKNEGTRTKNLAMRARAKLMLNSLYGKLATTLTTKSKKPYMGEDDIVHYKPTEEKEKRGVYLPARKFCNKLSGEIKQFEPHKKLWIIQ